MAVFVAKSTKINRFAHWGRC